MASITSNLNLVSPSHAAKEVTINALFNANSPAAFGGIASINGLQVTIYGGVIFRAGVATIVANATLSLTASRRNCVYLRNDGVIAIASATGTPAVDTIIPSDAILFYVIDVGTSTISSYTDYRASVQNHLKRVSITASNANITLNWTQANADVLVVSGTLTANVELIIPAALSKEYTIINKTTGSFTLTASTNTAQKVTITQNTARAVVSDGTDLYAIV